MILWVLFAVAALPIVCLSLKGLFVVATEEGKPPLQISRGVAWGEGGFLLEFEDPEGRYNVSVELDDVATTPPNICGDD